MGNKKKGFLGIACQLLIEEENMFNSDFFAVLHFVIK